MSPGKLASQAGHGFVEALRVASVCANSDYVTYVADPPGTKVVLEAPDEIALLRLHDEAQQRGIPSVLIYDSGHVLPPFFDGSSVLTAVGFGPATRRKVASLTRPLALVR